jgi:head-tail adaptor
VLTSDELADMRTAQDAALPDTCAIYRKSRSVDEAGGIVETRAKVADAACRVTRQRPRELQQGGKDVILADWVVTLPYGTDVRSDDEIETGGRVLRVVGLLNASWRTAERALCVS